MSEPTGGIPVIAALIVGLVIGAAVEHLSRPVSGQSACTSTITKSDRRAVD